MLTRLKDKVMETRLAEFCWRKQRTRPLMVPLSGLTIASFRLLLSTS